MTITNLVSPVRVETNFAEILSGAPVSSIVTWQQIAAASNWLNGFGAQLVPGSCGDSSKNEITGGSTGVWHFNTTTRKQAIQRVWALTLVGRSTESGASATISVNGAASLTVPVPSGYELAVPVLYYETLGAQASAVTDLALSITAVGKYVSLVSASCWEQWRPQLDASSDDQGINAQSFRPGQKVYTGAFPTTPESVTSVAAAIAAADARRVGICHWSVPSSNPATRNGAYVTINGLGMPVLARKIVSAATTGDVYWSAYAKVNAGNGDVKITTSASGVTDSRNITTTSYAWTSPKKISINCEDLTATDGLRGAAWDELQIAIRGNGGNTISVAAVSVWEG